MAKLPRPARAEKAFDKYVDRRKKEFNTIYKSKGVLNLGLRNKPIYWVGPIKSIHDGSIDCMYDYVPQEPRKWKFGTIVPKVSGNMKRLFSRRYRQLLRILLQLPLGEGTLRQNYRLTRYIVKRVLPKLKPLEWLQPNKLELLFQARYKYHEMYKHYRALTRVNIK